MKKYLRIKIEGRQGYLLAFEQANRKNPNAPHYASDDGAVAVWVNTTNNGDLPDEQASAPRRNNAEDKEA